MRKLVSLCLGIYFIPVIGHSQTNSTQLPNGVIVHQSQGVEGIPEKKSEKRYSDQKIALDKRISELKSGN